MTTVHFDLPDALVQRARSEGFLSDSALQELLEDAMRRKAGARLVEIARGLHAEGVAPMSDEELDAEIQAARASRRANGPVPPHGAQ